MNLQLRWKIAFSFTLLTAVAFGLLDSYLQSAALKNGQEGMREAMLNEARLIVQLLPPRPWQASAHLQAVVKHIDEALSARVTLINTDGGVLADSRDDPHLMGSHADRPERLQALSNGWGWSRRYSTSLQTDMLYVTLALPAQGSTAHSVLRLARPMIDVAQASQQMRQTTLLAFGITVPLVWLVSIWLAGTLSAPLQSLVRVARRVDRGDLQARVEDVRGGELAELSGTFNRALDSLVQLLATSRRESRYYAAILEQMSDAVVIVDSKGKTQFVNPTFARLFGIDAGAVTGRSSEQIALNYDLSSLLVRAVQQAEVQSEEIRVLHPEMRILATAVTPLLDEQQHMMGAVALLRDVTDLHRVDEIRREFVANASHELRTPAAGIKAMAEALQIGALHDPVRGPRFVQQIVDAADRLTSLLDDMLTLTRVERGVELLSIAPRDAAEALQEMAGQLLASAQAKNVDLQVQVQPGDRVVADLRGLHTVIVNLVDNAIKYTPAGGRVRLSGRSVANGYEISVSDTGVGISTADQSRIFERFYRVDRARDRATGGTGLGLSIVKHLVEAHRGRISVQSVVGEGSTFTVFFPFTPQA